MVGSVANTTDASARARLLEEGGAQQGRDKVFRAKACSVLPKALRTGHSSDRAEDRAEGLCLLLVDDDSGQ